MRDIRVATVQFQSEPGNKAYNLGRVRHFVTEAARSRVEIVAFPEMCLTGYWHVRKLSRDDVEALAEPVPDGECTKELLRLSREHGMSIGAGLIERDDDGRLYNAYVVAMPDGRWARHRKLHVFVSRFLSEGSEYTVFDTPHGCRVGILICYDNNIIENARITALRGAEILLAPHQTGGCNSVSPHAMKPIDPDIWARREDDPAACEAEICGPKGRGWLMRWLPSRAHDNGMFLLFSNGIVVDSAERVERPWRGWAARHSLDAEGVIAAAHGRRTLETVRMVAPQLTAEAEVDALEATEAMSAEGVYEVEGASELLEKLPAGSWAIVTSGVRTVAEFRIRHTGLPAPAVMICADEIARGKPDPEGYLNAAARLGRSASECIVIEDGPP